MILFLVLIFSTRCNIYISRLCYNVDEPHILWDPDPSTALTLHGVEQHSYSATRYVTLSHEKSTPRHGHSLIFFGGFMILTLACAWVYFSRASVERKSNVYDGRGSMELRCRTGAALGRSSETRA